MIFMTVLATRIGVTPKHPFGTSSPIRFRNSGANNLATPRLVSVGALDLI